MDIIDQLPADLRTKVNQDLQARKFDDFTEIVEAALHRFYNNAENSSLAGYSEDEINSLLFSEAVDEFESGKMTFYEDGFERLEGIKARARQDLPQ